MEDELKHTILATHKCRIEIEPPGGKVYEVRVVDKKVIFSCHD